MSGTCHKRLKRDAPVSRTCTAVGSSKAIPDCALASPPKMNILPWAATIACPDRGEGEGPIFWNMNHRDADPSAIPAAQDRSDRLTADPEGCEIAQILTIHISPTKHIDRILHHGRRVPFTRYGYVTDTRQLGPFSCPRVKAPYIVVMILPVCSAENV